MEQRHLDAAEQLAARAERLMAAAFERSVPFAPPAPAFRRLTDEQVRKAKTPGSTYRVVPGPHACRRWGDR